ncbi:MAG TPA: CHAT domain-containing protein [Anaerolineae bacterium]|nr:CHAT domain-containing protein [Anaerolineae bacterium]
MPDMPSLEIRLLTQQGGIYPVEMTLGETQQVFRGQLAGDIAAWSASGDSRVDGQTLFTALFASAELMRGWGAAHGRARQVRLQLRIDALELHALPWELLRDDQDLLTADADSPFSRYLTVSREWGQPITERPIRGLAVISNPKDIEEKYGLPPTDVALEARTLEPPPPTPSHDSDNTKQERESGEPGVRWTFLPEPVTLERLEAELRNGYHLLHFVGHGAFNARTQQAALYLQDAEGNAQRVIDDDFAGMLNRLAAPPHLVVLAACQSATQSMKAAFSGLGPKLVQIGVPAVVAMQENVTVLTARQFAATFYQRLLVHGMVDLAMNEARGTLITNARFDAAVPVLFMRLPDGRLWKAEDLPNRKPATQPSQVTKNVYNVSGGAVVTGGVISGDFVARDKNIITGTSQTNVQRVPDKRVTEAGRGDADTGGGGVTIKGKNVKIGGDSITGDKILTTGSSADIASLFATIYRQIDAYPDLKPRDKEDLKADVKDVEAETTKVAQGQKADESFLERRLRSIARMAPDILDVMATTFASPALGAATIIRKVIARVRQETS